METLTELKYNYLYYVSYHIEHLLNDAHATLSREILEFALNELKCLEEISARTNWIGLQRLRTEIAEQAYKLVTKLVEVVAQSESSLVDVDELKQEIRSFVGWVKKMEEEYADLLYNPLPPQDDEEEDDEQDGIDVKMVGSSDQYDELKQKLLKATCQFSLPLFGMPGIGKTTLARKVFEDPDIVKHFEVRVWVTVGGKCRLNNIPRRIMARMNPDGLNKMFMERDVVLHLRGSLKGKRYLIVLDDVWEKYMVNNLQLWSHFGVNPLGDLLPHELNGSCVLLTSRLQQGGNEFRMRLLDKEESWDLLCEKVFGKESYPTQFEEAGKKIAENCEGLPLTIVTVADRLSKVMEVEYWDEVAAKKNHKLFKDVYDEISKVILPSYSYLPRRLQSCFLYMGVFPPNYKIRRSKLINMWNIDGFYERNEDHDALICLEELDSNSLVMIYKNSTGSVGWKNIKTCGLHSSSWHLSTTEARKTKFCHVLSSLDDCLNEDMIGQQRLSFHNNILCSINDVYRYVEDSCASTVRSLLYYGPYHPYQLPICFGLSLLREIDLLTIRFYEFPMEVLRLVELRYLALTWDGKLPASISQLSNLRFLIVGRHFFVIKTSRDQYLPVEIWNLLELKHLQAMGSDLPHPNGASLENLSTLSNVSASSCTKEVFRAIPNLEKLGFQIELRPNGDGVPLRCLDHISHLEKLRSLNCVIVNPNIIFPGGTSTSFRLAVKKLRLSKLGRKERNGNIYHRQKLRYLKNVAVSPKAVPPLASLTGLPWSLKKLSLSGLGFPWKEMRKIAALPLLEVLKLRNYAFTGPYWRVKKFGFYLLRSLVIEESDLVEWSLESDCFVWLSNLTLKHCYKYERMRGELGRIDKIEFFACNPSGILQMQQTLQSPRIKWQIHSPLTDGENKTQ